MLPTPTPFPIINIDPTAMAQANSNIAMGIKLVWDEFGIAIVIVVGLIILVIGAMYKFPEIFNDLFHR